MNCDHIKGKPVPVTERIKTLKVIGEAVAQIVVEGELPINAIKIDKIVARLDRVEDRVFHNKVVKQGFIHKQVFFVDTENFVRHISEDIPFMIAVDIPGVRPGDNVEVQNHLLDIDTNFVLRPGISGGAGPIAILSQKVVAHVLVKVSEWTQLDVVTGLHFPIVQRSFCNYQAY